LKTFPGAGPTFFLNLYYKSIWSYVYTEQMCLPVQVVAIFGVENSAKIEAYHRQPLASLFGIS
jgi:hypothetical protein